MEITRRQLRLAVREAILGAPRLTTAECAALHSVARTATSFGTLFDTGCPAVLAGLVAREEKCSTRVWSFVSEFDKQMDILAKLADCRYDRVDRVQVID